MKLQAMLGVRYPRIVVTLDPEGFLRVEEERRRSADGVIRRDTLTTTRLADDQIRALNAVFTHYGLRDFGATVFSRMQGEVRSDLEGDLRTTTFSPDAPEGGASEGWLFPSGAADEVLDVFLSVGHEARFRPSAMPSWRPAPCRESSAGTPRTPDEKACLVYTIAPVGAGGVPTTTVAETTFFLSGRAVRERVEVGESGWDSFRSPDGEGRVSVERLDRVLRGLRAGHFFAAGNQTGTAYDGAEQIRLYYRGAIYTKTLCYEVEMGARCGLGPDEDEGLDAVRRLTRAAGL
jgi:hypothetical protein